MHVKNLGYLFSALVYCSAAQPFYPSSSYAEEKPSNFKGSYIGLQIGHGFAKVEKRWTEKGGGILWGWTLGYNHPLSSCTFLSPAYHKIVLGMEAYGSAYRYEAGESHPDSTDDATKYNTTKPQSHYGFAGRLGYEITPTTLAYAGIGFEKLSLSRTYKMIEVGSADAVKTQSANVSLWVPRIGVETKVTDSISVRLQYEQTLTKKGQNLDPIYANVANKVTFSRLTLGAAYHF